MEEDWEDRYLANIYTIDFLDAVMNEPEAVKDFITVLDEEGFTKEQVRKWADKCRELRSDMLKDKLLSLQERLQKYNKLTSATDGETDNGKSPDVPTFVMLAKLAQKQENATD